MTIQEAAFKLLNEAGKPCSSKDVARLALERRMVQSTAQDPIQSLAQTLEKNIRDGTYNNPKLIFVHSSQGRVIGLPGWTNAMATAASAMPSLIELRAKIPMELYTNIKLAELARPGADLDETVIWLLSKGLSLVAADIKKGLIVQLDSLNAL